MKTLFKITFLILFFATVSCINDKDLNDISGEDENLVTSGPMQGMNVSDDFDYRTSMDIELNLTVPSFLKDAVFTLYSKTGTSDSLNLGRATFNDSGVFNRTLTLSTTTDSIIIYSNYIGLTKDLRLPIVDNQVVFDYNSFYSDQERIPNNNDYQNPEDTNFSYLSSYNWYGLPSNLTTSDNIDASLLQDINNSLPESVPGGVPTTHPEFLAGKETEIILLEDADVWVTFVSEGAGYRNSLGYYTYTVGNEPANENQIDTHYIVFPNASMNGSGGKMRPGHKVHLGFFQANTVISWFLVADGWSGSYVKSWSQIYYANPNFNPESNADKKQHMVLLHDQGRNLNLFGFEDLNRQYGNSDDDFNDAVFYVTSNPVTAISNDNVADLDLVDDADNDGISDHLDEYPNDPNKAFNNYYPSLGNKGTLAYEDLWPSTGDYDFNDLVLDYDFNLITNGDNKVTTIEASYTVEHIGAAFHNGFAFVLPINTSDVSSVSGQVLNGGYEQVNGNGTEIGTAANETIIYVSGDTFSQTGQTITVTVTLSNGFNMNALGTVPFNTFLIVNGEREREVHLPDYMPTSKALYLGTGNDYSDPANNIYYKTEHNLPWGLNIYDNFEYPSETTPIIDVYPRFKTWANSGGTTDMDWYKD